MNINYQLVSSICSGLIVSLSVIPQIVLAQEPVSSINPCPKIFYEEPHNNRVFVPQGCPPNAITRRRMEQGFSPTPSTPNQREFGMGGEAPPRMEVQPPGSTLPEPSFRSTSPTFGTRIQAPETQKQYPRTVVSLADGKVNIKLVNNTNTDIKYQVIGDTGQRSLPVKSDFTLRDLSAPITVTFQREDGRFLMVTPKPTQESGMMEVTFQETGDVNQDRSAMSIQSDGAVFLN
ncbi:hypothetical protein VB711_06710 [Cronbergia sp. UHCC 0137]|uniref:hypothetical protein n=1 Tax=Cronbergia sp. UHCC 0137 TaxID=3110239 RepID=UPI002B1FB098|nr:hypothetical protein [Cronbergia sp. UHCC 0137]MEA5617529.1 hypothetical protein [Cronbergia sp. UHCC 0137]